VAATCGNGRYVADVFQTVQTTTAVLFGSNTNINYSTSEESGPVPLYLDFYEPVGDAAAQRPLLILAFGGSFTTGSRQDANIVSICQAFARKGYATAAIDYRLIPPGTNGVNYIILPNRPSWLTDEIVRAANDMRASVRFFRATASTYRIDPTRIFVGGFSAGAITALQVGYTETATENSDANIQAAYTKYGGLEGNTDLPGNSLLGTYNSQNVAGVFSLAGGINDLNLLNTGNPPIYSA
jgi:acetyl esterase/lipase